MLYCWTLKKSYYNLDLSVRLSVRPSVRPSVPHLLGRLLTDRVHSPKIVSWDTKIYQQFVRVRVTEEPHWQGAIYQICKYIGHTLRYILIFSISHFSKFLEKRVCIQH